MMPRAEAVGLICVCTDSSRAAPALLSTNLTFIDLKQLPVCPGAGWGEGGKGEGEGNRIKSQN